MKWARIIRNLSVAVSCLMLSSCFISDTGLIMPQSVPYGSLERNPYYPQTYRSAPTYSGYSNYGYRSYSRPTLCSRCGYSTCRCSSHRSHSSHSSSSVKHVGHKASDHNFKIVGGSTGSKKKPTGHHPLSWYKSRGYDLNKLKLQNKLGEKAGGLSSSKKRKR